MTEEIKINAQKEENRRSLPFFGLPAIYPYLKQYRGSVAFICIFMAGTTLGDILFPLFTKYAVDELIVAKNTAAIPYYALAYCGVVLMQLICTVLWARRSCEAEVYASRDLKRAAFNHLQTLSFSYFNQNAVGYIHSRVMSDTGKISMLVSWDIVDLTYSLLYIVGSFTVMFAVDWRMALIVAAALPFIALVSVFFQKRMIAANRHVRELNSRITGAINEGITGAKTTKTLVTEEKMERGFRERTKEMRIQSVYAARLQSAYISIITSACFIAIAFVLWYGGAQVKSGAMLIGTLSVFTNYALIMSDPLRSLARVFADLVNIGVNIERYTRLLETKPDVADTPEVEEKYGTTFAPKRENWEPLVGDIEFRDVSFKYPDGGGYVLEHFNLKVPARTRVAIVGETGAGKSTLVNLVCRFFEPTDGQILIDGRDYRERSQLWLHSNLGYVLQSPHLFSGTVRDNLLFGREDATEEEMLEALRAVGADKLLERLGGLDAQVGEGGDLLSTGEKQLVSFARAILADPAIFVLDEATSSVDTVTEQLIAAATEKLLRGRTSFVIAHRLSTIRTADIILVVRDGKIVERGTHANLMAADGYYRDLYMRQFADINI